jgi:ribonucleoside-diphosphate reductase alpha chain
MRYFSKSEIKNLLPYDRAKLLEFINELFQDIEGHEELVNILLNDVELGIFPNISLDQLFEILVLSATQNMQNNILFDVFAKRFLLVQIYYYSLIETESEDTYTASFKKYIKSGLEMKLLHASLDKTYLDKDITDLANSLVKERDDNFDFVGLDTVLKRYLKLDWEQKPFETPQFMWMRIAMWMAIKEKDPVSWAKKFYDKISKGEYISGGSTNIGAGTTYPTLSNCFIMDTQDDTVSIFDNIKNIALISKATGGIGLSVTKLRASGSPVRSNNTFSTGPIPFIKVMDATLKSMARAGKKHGAMCVYMENWHYDFQDFLDLKQNSGDDYRRVRTADTAVYISDEFMKRVTADEDWYLFDPGETTDLPELYGDEFSKAYSKYCEMAEAGEIKLFKKMKAREQYSTILASLVSTSHPWLTWKDAINVRALNNNTGTIHSSNLCTEICLPQDRENIAVCNLAYVNLAKHVLLDEKENASIDWDRLKDSVRTAIHHLDNLIDVNLLSVAEARKSDQDNRAIGLGMSGMAEVFELFKTPYDSDKAYKLADEITEFISYNAIEKSTELAKERGSYKNFEGSMWSKGLVPYDTIALLESNRQLTQDKSIRLDWDKLREKVKKGIRNATLMAIAPNPSTGLVLGTSPGIDVRFAQIFSRATSRGKYLDINKNLVKALNKLGLWSVVKDKIISSLGDISEIDEIPQEIRDIYKTSFQVSPYGVIEVASRAQKWIDQSLSRNMYLETREINDLMNIYTEAWKRGLKTTYYLHVKPRHTAEQSTVKVNKSVEIKKSGFAGILSKSEAVVPEQSQSAVVQTGAACPTDPAERALCEACQ